MHTLIKKRPLEIVTLVILGVILLAFIIATIILALKLKDMKNTPTDCQECLACATNPDGNQICCHTTDGSPVIAGDKYTCKKM